MEIKSQSTKTVYLSIKVLERNNILQVEKKVEHSQVENGVGVGRGEFYTP